MCRLIKVNDRIQIVAFVIPKKKIKQEISFSQKNLGACNYTKHRISHMIKFIIVQALP